MWPPPYCIFLIMHRVMLSPELMHYEIVYCSIIPTNSQSKPSTPWLVLRTERPNLTEVWLGTLHHHREVVYAFFHLGVHHLNSSSENLKSRELWLWPPAVRKPYVATISKGAYFHAIVFSTVCGKSWDYTMYRIPLSTSQTTVAETYPRALAW